MTWLAVTPARNEAARLPLLAASLAAQTVQPIGLWVIVDDASVDGTATCVDPAGLPFPVHVVRRPAGAQGLARGGAFAAWYAGTDAGLERLPGAERVLKLDADVVLDPEYFARLSAAAGDAGLAGGILTGPAEREQRHHVRGPLKAYRRDAFAIVRALPAAAGHDVLDEVALRAAGLEVRIVPEATATVSRATGTSEGVVRGRVRNGKVSRWTGYHPLYFALRLARYAARRPALLGSIAMAWGWATAGPSPYPAALRRAHRAEQTERLRQLARNPIGYVRRAFDAAAPGVAS